MLSLSKHEGQIMQIALLRHGPTDWNAAGRIQGHIDMPLSAAGAAQMAALRLPRMLAPKRVFSSPMLRARQTAQALGLADSTLADLILDARLMEQNWGRWEGLTREEIIARDGAECYVRAGARRGGAFRPPGGESTQEVLDRVAAFLRDVAAGEGDAAAVTHLGVLRAAYTLATGWTMDAPMPPELDVSRILVLELERDGEPRIGELNMAFVTAMPVHHGRV
jgi:probable phosphoglycerate mutase